jgi:hypothetical protein
MVLGRVKMSHQAEREVVEEVVGGGGRATARRRPVDAHLVVGLVVQARSRAQRTRNALRAVAEAHHAPHAHLDRFQRAASAYASRIGVESKHQGA